FASVRVGGNRIDEAVISYVKRKYNLMIGETTAEAVKIGIGSALPLEEEMRMEVRGRDQVSGLPKTIQVTSGEVTDAISEPLSAIVGVVKGVLEKTPPELASDVIDRGIVMSGGGALLRNFHTLLTKETGVPCYVADNPMACVALGAGKALEDYEVIKRSLPAY
ncbi:MAG: rod shape-determining protein, partial [Anaerolineae bacterium]